MIPNKSKSNQNIHGASTRRGDKTTVANHSALPRKEFPPQTGMDSLLPLIAKGRLGIYRLISVARNR